MRTSKVSCVSARAPAVAGLLVLMNALSSCKSAETARNPEDACAEACAKRAAGHCSDHECARGCRFVLDRLIEHEGEHVLACVARAKGACDDALFADCAVHIGEHADGGPPAPPPPDDE